MPREQFNLDREFIKWFYEEAYPDVGSNRSTVQAQNAFPIAGVDARDYWMRQAAGVNARDYWMRQAFKHGARQMAQDMLDTLAHYACAVEGLEPEMLEPCEVYDRARESLFVYATKVLDEANA